MKKILSLLLSLILILSVIPFAGITVFAEGDISALGEITASYWGGNAIFDFYYGSRVWDMYGFSCNNIPLSDETWHENHLYVPISSPGIYTVEIEEIVGDDFFLDNVSFSFMFDGSSVYVANFTSSYIFTRSEDTLTIEFPEITKITEVRSAKFGGTDVTPKSVNGNKITFDCSAAPGTHQSLELQFVGDSKDYISSFELYFNSNGTVTNGYSVPYEEKGTADDPYLISTAEEFYAIDSIAKASGGCHGMYFALTRNIDNITQGVTSEEFYGTFDGRCYTLTLNLNNNIFELDSAGLFWCNNGIIKNLITEGTVKSNHCAAAVCRNNDGIIMNCINKASVNGVQYSAGLSTFCSMGGVIINCANFGEIASKSSSATSGGIVGSMCDTGSKVENCLNTGSVSVGHSLGAIAGYVFFSAAVANSFYTNTNLNVLTNGGNSINTNNTLITDEQARTLADTLNANIESTDFTRKGELLKWKNTPDGYPDFVFHRHNISSTWSFDGNHHWHVCTADGCYINSYAICNADGVDYGTHNGMDDGICDVCGYADIAVVKPLIIAQIDEAVGENPSFTVKTIVSFAKANINNATEYEDITRTRDNCLSAIAEIISAQKKLDFTFEIPESEIFIARNGEYTLSAIFPDDAENTSLTWESTNPNIADVDENGVVTGKTAGITVIKATSAYNGYSAFCAVKVVGIEALASSTASIDYEKGLITGLNTKCRTLNNYLAVTDETCELSCDGYGTDTIAYLMRNGEIIDAYTLVVDGDVNGDGFCDVLDAADCERAINGHTSLDGAFFAAADGNGDEILNPNDYSSIVNNALGK